MSYGEAWSAWVEGRSTEDLVLWGQPVMWWGRLGAVLQLLGALTVVVDLIGADRLRDFGTRLRQNAPQRPEKGGETRPWVLVLAIALVMAVPIAAMLWLTSGNLELTFLIVVVMALLVSWAGPFVVFAAYALVFLLVQLVVGPVGWIAWFIDRIMIRPVAWALDRPRLDWWAKLLGTLLLMIGSHWALLGT